MVKSEKEFKGLHILEVWDFRLSNAHPLVRNDIGDTWQVQIWANDNPDYDPEEPLAEPLEVHDTGIKCESGDCWDAEKMKACYEWLYSVRDKYARDHIELRKPITKLINESNANAAKINFEAQQAKAEGNTRFFYEKTGELQAFLKAANAQIKQATKIFHAQVGGAV